MAAQKNYDGTVTMRTRGTLAYTPRSQSSIGRAFTPAQAPGGLARTATTNGRLTRQKGAGYTGRSAYS